MIEVCIYLFTWNKLSIHSPSGAVNGRSTAEELRSYFPSSLSSYTRTTSYVQIILKIASSRMYQQKTNWFMVLYQHFSIFQIHQLRSPSNENFQYVMSKRGPKEKRRKSQKQKKTKYPSICGMK